MIDQSLHRREEVASLWIKLREVFEVLHRAHYNAPWDMAPRCAQC